MRHSSPPLAPELPDELQKNGVAFHVTHQGKNEKAYLNDVLQRRYFRAGGHYARAAETALRSRCQENNIYLTNSCTAAMEIAALVSGLGPDDEVIIPTYTFCATATAFARTGARIVLCDVSPDTMMMDVDDVAAKITPRTRAVVPVHYGGCSVDMEHLHHICSSRDILIIEDAAQGLGATRNGRALGTLGNMGAYSFHETKIAHCGQGGALLVNGGNAELIRRIDQTLQRGTNFSDCRKGLVSHYEWTRVGGSFQPSELDAALLLSQLEELDLILEKRLNIDALYRQLLARSGLQLMTPDARTRPNGHAVVLILENAELAGHLIKQASNVGIQLQSHYKPLHMSEYGRKLGYNVHDLPVAAKQWNCLVRLPIHTAMSQQEVVRVAEFITEFTAKNSPSSLASAYS